MERQKVRVLYYGLIRNIVGMGAEEVEMPEGATVGALVEALAAKYGDRFRERLMGENGGVHHNVKIFVGDTPIGEADGLGTRLSSEGGVTFVTTISQMSGG